MLDIDYPLIVAPMFLISNSKMVIAALETGVTAAFPALNYRTSSELEKAVVEIKSKTDKPFGVNLIVNRSNIKYKSQLEVLLKHKVAFIITSLGNPKEVIEKCKPLNIKVFCDVVDLKYAKKVCDLGADALIAVNSSAGGHPGKLTAAALIPELKKNCNVPLIAAGGIGTAEDIEEMLKLGADGVSVGTVFLASEEASISDEYRNALISYDENDIVLSTKFSGSPLTVINTPFVQKTGTRPTFLEWVINHFKPLKKYAKLILAYRGMNTIERAAKKPSYKTVWCAGPSIKHIHKIEPIQDIIKRLIRE